MGAVGAVFAAFSVTDTARHFLSPGTVAADREDRGVRPGVPFATRRGAPARRRRNAGRDGVLSKGSQPAGGAWAGAFLRTVGEVELV